MDTQKPFTGMLAVKKYFEDGACKVQAKEFNEFWKVCTAADKAEFKEYAEKYFANK